MVFFRIKVGILFDTTNTIAFNQSGFNTFHWQTFDMCLSAFGLFCHSSYDCCIHLIRSINIIFRPRQYLTENRTNMKFSSHNLIHSIRPIRHQSNMVRLYDCRVFSPSICNSGLSVVSLQRQRERTRASFFQFPALHQSVNSLKRYFSTLKWGVIRPG